MEFRPCSTWSLTKSFVLSHQSSKDVSPGCGHKLCRPNPWKKLNQNCRAKTQETSKWSIVSASWSQRDCKVVLIGTIQCCCYCICCSDLVGQERGEILCGPSRQHGDFFHDSCFFNTPGLVQNLSLFRDTLLMQGQSRAAGNFSFKVHLQA